MYNTILVPLDGSARAEAIIPHVENLAHHKGAKVVFTQVIEPVSRSFVLDPDAPPKYKFDPQTADKAGQYLAAWQNKFQAQNLEADTLLMYGQAVEGVIHAADEAQADLIALTSQGRTGLAQVFYGSTASGVMNRARRPLLIVHAHTEAGTEANRNILVPLDGSPRSERILPYVEGVAHLYDADVTLARIVMTTHQTTVFEDFEKDLEDEEVHGHLFRKLDYEHEVERVKDARQHLLDTQARLQQKNIKANAMLLHGRPVDGIAYAAEKIDADLIALTSKGRTGLAQVFYGSVASGVLNRVRRPLLVMRTD